MNQVNQGSDGAHENVMSVRLMPMKTDLVSMETIQEAILLVRGQRVMLDRDLAMLYEVKTRALNQAVKRNREDFMFALTREEIMRMSQSVISSSKLISERPDFSRPERVD